MEGQSLTPSNNRRASLAGLFFLLFSATARPVGRSCGKLLLFCCVGLAGLLASPEQAHAVQFANQFIQFELPPSWQCKLEGAEWVCQSTNESKQKDAIIVLAAKLKGDQDSLDQYKAYLSSAKTFTSVQGTSLKSEPKYAKYITLNDHSWVDSLHLESEIPGFYTRYLATVKQDIGVLVTYSIHRAKYQQYLDEFENMVKTLRVFRKAGSINVSPANGNLFDGTKIPSSITENTVFPGAASVQGGAADGSGKPKGGDDGFPLPVLLIGAAIVGFIIWKKRQNQG